MIGRTISHYRVVSQLGVGGMGVVYAAEDTRLGRSVALKFVPENLAKDDQTVARLRVEARAASGLNHPNICTIHDIGEDDGRPFIVMELLKGQTLTERLSRGPLRTHEVVEFGLQIADALDAAHANNIIHRDIKPANIFITERGQVKILDFGVAKLVHPLTGDTGLDGRTTESGAERLTNEGMAVGTVAYMSPEQASGEVLDGRTDLFSLGTVLYECATGRRPFTGPTPAVILSAILNKSPTQAGLLNDDLPARLQDVISNCLEKDRELRYQGAADLRADLKRIQRDLASGQAMLAPPSDGGEAPAAHSGLHSAAGLLGQGQTGNTPLAPERVATQGPSVGTLLWITVMAAVVLGGAYVSWQSFGPSARLPIADRDASGEDAEAGSAPEAAQGEPPARQLELAAASLAGRQYRDALRYAGEVLAVAPAHPDAIDIQNQAEAALNRFDAAVADVERLLVLGDPAGASSALERARAIDPDAPQVAALSVQVLDAFRALASTASPAPVASSREPATDGAMTRAAPPETPETAPAPPAPEPSVPPPGPAQPGAGRSRLPEPPPAPSDQPVPEADLARETPSIDQGTSQPSLNATVNATGGLGARPASDVPAPAPVDDDALIREVVAAYARAIETQDIDLYRAVKPNLTADEERRLTESFRGVSSHHVELTVLSIERGERQAIVRVHRIDTIPVAGRPQTTDRQQTLTMVQTAGKWFISELGQ